MAQKTVANKKTTAKNQAPAPARTIWLATLGFYGRLYDEALTRTETQRARLEDLLGDFIVKGTEIEEGTRVVFEKAQQETADNLKTARTQLEASLEERIAKLRSTLAVPALPASVFPANARIQELEAEVEALTKKVNTLTRARNAAQKTAAPRTAKSRTAKKAA